MRLILSSLYSCCYDHGSNFHGRGQSGHDGAACIDHILTLMPTSGATGVVWPISRAEVLEISMLSCGLSLVISSVKSVASWLAREMET